MVQHRNILLGIVIAGASFPIANAQTPRPLMPIEFQHSAEFAWLRKPVKASRILDDMARPDRWRFSGTGTITFPEVNEFNWAPPSVAASSRTQSDRTRGAGEFWEHEM